MPTKKKHKKVGRQVNALLKKQAELKRGYMKYYKKLEKYGQAPAEPLEHPWARDIRRLEKRWGTVKKYASVYNRYRASVAKFNAEYMQNVSVPEPHTRIIPATLETLEAEYKSYQKMRRSFVRRVQSAEKLLRNNLNDMLEGAFAYATPTHYASAGEQTPHQQEVMDRTQKFTHFLQDITPKDPMKRAAMYERIIGAWDELKASADVFIYDSNQQRVGEAWAKIVYYMTGDGIRDTQIYDAPESDLYYE